MDRRTFLTTMMQGTFAAALLPNSISPFLIAQYGSLSHFGDNYQQRMRISAVGIGTFGAYCTRLLAYSVHNISCYEISPGLQRLASPDFAGLNSAIQHTDLLFLLADATQSSNKALLTACADAATAAGIQTVVLSPHVTAFHSSQPFASSALPLCSVEDPSTARDLVALVADLVNTDSFVGIDHGDVMAILRSGSQGVLAVKEASGVDRGDLASRDVLEQLQKQAIDTANCRGAMACIYGGSKMTFDDYGQAITVLDDYFPHDTTFVFGSVVDKRLGDAVRVAILAMK
jgi:hypothetical protein